MIGIVIQVTQIFPVFLRPKCELDLHPPSILFDSCRLSRGGSVADKSLDISNVGVSLVGTSQNLDLCVPVRARSLVGGDAERQIFATWTVHCKRAELSVVFGNRTLAVVSSKVPFLAIEVGTPVTQRPPRRSRRAVFPHRAPRGVAHVHGRLQSVLLGMVDAWRVGQGSSHSNLELA